MISEASSASEIKNINSFPKTKHYLWDKTVVGQSTFLHIAHYRKPRVCIPEKILRLIQHQCEHFDRATHHLIGSVLVEEDGEGIRIQIDRLDTRTSVSKDNYVPGELVIPLKVSNNEVKETQTTVSEYIASFQNLQERCCSKTSIELSSFLTCEGFVTFYSNTHTSVVHLDLDLISIETVFKVTPIPAIPIVLTALSKNLAGPRSLSKVQGVPKTGYLTMDHTRKLLLVLESDPKASSLPLVGIWISGVEFVQHPFVWASCLRYIHNAFLQDRINLPPEDFLLIFYTTLHTKPEFYQCNTVSGTRDLGFKLYSGHEVTHIAKAFSSPCENVTEVEMGSTHSPSKQEIFDAARTKHKQQMFNGNSSSGFSEDIEPRSAPVPHMEKVPVFHPVVPDVSVLWAESPVVSPQRSTMNRLYTPSYSVLPYSGTMARPPVQQPLNASPMARLSVQQPQNASPMARPSVQQFQRSPQVPTPCPLAQQYSPAFPVRFVQPNVCPSSHSADTLTINSHISVSSQGTKPYPGSQEHLAGHPSPQYMLSTSNQYGPVPAFSSNSYALEIAGRNEPATETKTGQSNVLAYSTSNPIQYFDNTSYQRTDKSMPSLPDQVISPNMTRNRCIQPSALKTVVEESASNPGELSSQDRLMGLSSDGSASEDSGLSTTPDKNSSLQQKLPLGGADSGLAQGSDKLSWDQLPADIRSLLIQQNEQIKLLQQQIQVLLQQQARQTSSQPAPCSHHSTFQSDSGTSNRPDQPSLPLMGNNDTVSPEHSPPRGNISSSTAPSVQSLSCTTSQSRQDVERASGSNTATSQNASLPNYMSPSQHLSQNREPLYSTASLANHLSDKNRQTTEISSQQRLPLPESNTKSQLEVKALTSSSRQSVNSSGSEIADDTPYFDRSQLDQSPISVSQYSCNYQDESNSTLAEDATDPKQYYDQLMNNIQMFLSNTPNSEALTESDTCPEETVQTPTTLANGALAQQISYVSMLLGCGGDVGQSMEINAMAMKYLNDEQLTQMARLWKDAGYRTNQSSKVLQKVFSGALSAHEVSMWGSSPNMTMGTQMYLARHGLLGNDSFVMTSSNTDQASMMEKFQLKTDFSTLTIGSQDSDKKLACEMSGIDTNKRMIEPSTPIRTPLRQEMTSAQRYAHSQMSNENWLPSSLKPGGHNKDNGASPLLGGKAYGEPGLRNVLQEVRRQDSSRKKLPVASTMSEDENLLDIAKLKQLPKLL